MHVVEALDASSGRVLVHQEGCIAGRVFAAFVRQLVAAYPDAQQVYLIWDTWPVHRCAELQAVLTQFPQLQVVALPTYAPWLNPIEKRWRKLRQDLTALHQLARDWKQCSCAPRRSLSRSLMAPWTCCTMSVYEARASWQCLFALPNYRFRL